MCRDTKHCGKPSEKLRTRVHTKGNIYGVNSPRDKLASNGRNASMGQRSKLGWTS